MPDPTTVTLCFCSWEPKVAIALTPHDFEVANRCFEGSELRIEAEMLATRRRAAPLEAAMLAVIVGKLEIPKEIIFFYSYGLLGDSWRNVEESNSARLLRLTKGYSTYLK